MLRGAANATSSCRLSQLICLADAQCATALGYYNQLCRSVYRGRKCSNKCRNSIQILRKQEKAAALTACRCDGNEDYDCPRMQNNLARLCFHKHLKNHTKSHEKGHENKHKKHHHQETPSATSPVTMSYLLFVLCTLISLNYNTWHKLPALPQILIHFKMIIISVYLLPVDICTYRFLFYILNYNLFIREGLQGLECHLV